MLKPSGLLVYSTGPIAGAGGQVTIDLLGDDDDAGNHYDEDRIDSVVASALFRPWFQASGVAASGDPGAITVGYAITVDGNGKVTVLTATITNNSTGAGDTVSGSLFSLIPQAGNYGV